MLASPPCRRSGPVRVAAGSPGSWSEGMREPIPSTTRDTVFQQQPSSGQPFGGMAEWLKAAVLKTVEPSGSVGSNPTPSASGDAERWPSWLKAAAC